MRPLSHGERDRVRGFALLPSRVVRGSASAGCPRGDRGGGVGKPGDTCRRRSAHAVDWSCRAGSPAGSPRRPVRQSGQARPPPPHPPAGRSARAPRVACPSCQDGRGLPPMRNGTTVTCNKTNVKDIFPISVQVRGVRRPLGAMEGPKRGAYRQGAIIPLLKYFYTSACSLLISHAFSLHCRSDQA